MPNQTFEGLPGAFDVGRQRALGHPYGAHAVMYSTWPEPPLRDVEASTFAQNNAGQWDANIPATRGEQRHQQTKWCREKVKICKYGRIFAITTVVRLRCCISLWVVDFCLIFQECNALDPVQGIAASTVTVRSPSLDQMRRSGPTRIARFQLPCTCNCQRPTRPWAYI